MAVVPKGVDAAEPHALARFAERVEAAAFTTEDASAKNKLLLEAFKYYAAASERARIEDWPDDAWRNWRYRRASLARALARKGMMQEVADVYGVVHQKYRPPSPSVWHPLAISRVQKLLRGDSGAASVN